jgi:DNA-binding GntR family transcriptional regulator
MASLLKNPSDFRPSDLMSNGTENGTDNRTDIVRGIFEWILRQLSLREFCHGVHLKPHRIAAELGVSATSVRRSLELLVEAGWAERTPTGRVIVAQLPPREEGEPQPFLAKDNDVDVAHRAIREKVLRGELPLDEPINAKRLAEELGVSMPALRQALEGATRAGIIERQPRRGWCVIPLTSVEVRDLFRVRLRLEPLALKYAIRRITDETLDALEAENERIYRLKNPSRYDIRQADYNFHTTLFEASGRRVLAAVLEPLLQRLFVYPGKKRVSDTSNEHQSILDAIRQRDQHNAVQALRAHLKESARRYLAVATKDTENKIA